MLKPVAEGPGIVLCSTCRHQGAPGAGAAFARLVRQAASAAVPPVQVDEMPCLFACARGCTVHLRAPGRIGYVLGSFAPSEAAARALVAFFLLYRDSPHGEVPYGQWPDGVKGHFIVRVPPPGHVVG